MLLEYISLASGLNFTFLAIVLYRRNTRNSKSTNILIRLMLCMALYCSIVFFHYSAVDKSIESILLYYLPIDGILFAALAPCLYFYVMAMIEAPINQSRSMVFLHSLAFIPFIVFNLYFMMLSRDDRMEWLMRDFHTGTVENNLLNAVLYIQIIVYLSVSYFQVCIKIKQSYCNAPITAAPNLNWLKNYLLINLVYTLLSAPICFYFANERANIIIGQLAMNIQFVYLFFRIIANDDTATALIQNCTGKKAFDIKLNNEIADIQILKLNAYMQEFKPYLDEECCIQTISVQTGIPQYQLTNLLNCKLRKSFPDFINEYRIAATKQMLLSQKRETSTIDSIAAECGFGSKSSFNRAFKKFSNNLTPSEFIQQHKCGGI